MGMPVRLDDADDLGRVIGDLQEGEVALVDGAVPQHGAARPVEQALPVGRPDQDHREVPHLAGLDEGQRLEQLVEGPEPARQDHEPVGVLYEHGLAREEVAELDAEVDVRVEPLFMGQLDVAADRQPAALTAAAVGRLHRARSAAGDHGVARLSQLPADHPGQLVQIGSLRRPGRAEDRDRPADRRQGVEAVDELGLDAQHPPGVAVEELGRRAPREELLVLGRGRVPLQADHGGRGQARPARASGAGRGSFGSVAHGG
jgi:hypothetical protein